MEGLTYQASMDEVQREPGAAAGSAAGHSELALARVSLVTMAVKQEQEEEEEEEEQDMEQDKEQDREQVKEQDREQDKEQDKEQDEEQDEFEQDTEQDKEQDNAQDMEEDGEQEQGRAPTAIVVAEVYEQQEVATRDDVELGQHRRETASEDLQGLQHSGFAAVPALTGAAQSAGAESLDAPGAEAGTVDVGPSQTATAADGSEPEPSTLELAVQVLGAPAHFPGGAAPFPGQAGDVVLCKSCMKPEGPYTSALCDRCDSSYHMACVGLDRAEIRRLDEWLCPSCADVGGTWTWQLGKVKAGVAQTSSIYRHSPRKKYPVKRKGSSTWSSGLATPQQGDEEEGSQQKRSRSMVTPESGNDSLKAARDEHMSEPQHQSPRMELRSAHKNIAQSVVDPDTSAGEEDGVGYTQEDYDKRCEQAMKKLQVFVTEKSGVLEKGWKARCMRVKQQKCLQPYYLSPTGHRLQSRVQVARYLGLLKDDSQGPEQGPGQEPGTDSPVPKPLMGSSRVLKAVEELQVYVAEYGGALEEGWTAQVVPRKHDRGRMHICYHSPPVNGRSHMFRTKAKVAKYLGLLDGAGESARHGQISGSELPLVLREAQSSGSHDPTAGPVSCSTPQQVETKPSQEPRQLFEPETAADQVCSETGADQVCPETRPCGWEYLS